MTRWPAWVIFNSEEFVRRVADECFGRKISDEDVRLHARRFRDMLAKAKAKKL